MTIAHRSDPARDPGRVTLSEPVPEVLDFRCPRCSSDAHEAWYGPCSSCRIRLRADVTGEARQVDTGDYEPKMNVTPNAVATKD